MQLIQCLQKDTLYMTSLIDRKARSRKGLDRNLHMHPSMAYCSSSRQLRATTWATRHCRCRHEKEIDSKKMSSDPNFWVTPLRNSIFQAWLGASIVWQSTLEWLARNKRNALRFSRPKLIPPSQLSRRRTSLLTLSKTLQDPDSSFELNRYCRGHPCDTERK